MDIVQFLKTNRNSRKIFGEREIKIIEKQINGVNLTQSEKNRLSRDIREKFNFIKDASRFSDEFELKKGSRIKEIVEESKKIILGDDLSKRIKRIIFFGSSVENKRSFRSDIDIAVDFSGIESKEAALFRKRLFGKLNENVDIEVYNILPEKIKKEIDEKGKVIYQK